jgi:chemotaxis protein CheD
MFLSSPMRRTPHLDELVLLPGHYFIAGSRCRMRTVLGSGVVIALWHRAQRTGAMAHFVPSLRNGELALDLGGHSGREALQLVLHELQCSHLDPAHCVARICGGGTVVACTDHVPSLNTGQANGEFARRLLRAYGLPIVSESFYPIGRRQVIFDVNTGRVQARRVKPVIVAIDVKSKPVAQPPLPERRQRVSALAR